MPIVVDEVVITVEVGNAAGGAATPSASAEDRQALIAECVERVLEVLRDRAEP